MEQAIAETRAALNRDPLQLPRLRQLVDLLVGAWRDGRERDATEVVGQVLGLIGELPPGMIPVMAAPRPLAAPLPNGFWAALADPPALGFMTEVWLLIADAVLEMHPPDIAALGAVRQTRILAENQPELGWVLEAAATLGLPSLLLYRAPRRRRARGRGAAGRVSGAGVGAGRLLDGGRRDRHGSGSGGPWGCCATGRRRWRVFLPTSCRRSSRRPA